MYMQTCGEAFAVLLWGEKLCVLEAAVGHLADAKAEHRVRHQELRHRRERGLAVILILSQLHHVQDLARDERQW